MKLIRPAQNQILVENLVEAKSLRQRLQGLLGRTELKPNEGLWITSCNSIHTFFMKFSIDAIFVDKNFRVCSLYHSLPPWRITKMVCGANSVIELAAGTAKEKMIQVGETLHVAP